MVKFEPELIGFKRCGYATNNKEHSSNYLYRLSIMDNHDSDVLLRQHGGQHSFYQDNCLLLWSLEITIFSFSKPGRAITSYLTGLKFTDHEQAVNFLKVFIPPGDFLFRCRTCKHHFGLKKSEPDNWITDPALYRCGPCKTKILNRRKINDSKN